MEADLVYGGQCLSVVTVSADPDPNLSGEFLAVAWHALSDLRFRRRKLVRHFHKCAKDHNNDSFILPLRHILNRAINVVLNIKTNC